MSYLLIHNLLGAYFYKALGYMLGIQTWPICFLPKEPTDHNLKCYSKVKTLGFQNWNQFSVVEIECKTWVF